MSKSVQGIRVPLLLISMVMGDHFRLLPHRISVFLHEGNDNEGFPTFRNVSEQAGIETASARLMSMTVLPRNFESIAL